MTPQTLTFSASPQQVQKLITQLQASGSQVTQQPDGSYLIKGHATLGDIAAIATYAAPALTVVVTKRGWNPIGGIESEIKKHLES